MVSDAFVKAGVYKLLNRGVASQLSTEFFIQRLEADNIPASFFFLGKELKT